MILKTCGWEACNRQAFKSNTSEAAKRTEGNRALDAPRANYRCALPSWSFAADHGDGRYLRINDTQSIDDIFFKIRECDFVP